MDERLFLRDPAYHLRVTLAATVLWSEECKNRMGLERPYAFERLASETQRDLLNYGAAIVEALEREGVPLAEHSRIDPAIAVERAAGLLFPPEVNCWCGYEGPESGHPAHPEGFRLMAWLDDEREAEPGGESRGDASSTPNSSASTELSRLGRRLGAYRAALERIRDTPFWSSSHQSTAAVALMQDIARDALD